MADAYTDVYGQTWYVCPVCGFRYDGRTCYTCRQDETLSAVVTLYSTAEEAADRADRAGGEGAGG